MDIRNYKSQFAALGEISIALKSIADTINDDTLVWNDKSGITYQLSFQNKHLDIFEERSILNIDNSSNQDVYTVIGIAKVHNLSVTHCGLDL